MDQIDRLIFDVQGRDRGGSKVLDDTSRKAEAAHLSMSKLGSTLSGLGGPFEQVIGYGGQLAGSFDASISKAQKLGLATAATGALLIGVAAKDQQAQRQLQQAVDNTGDSYSDYREEIEASIHRQENFAHSADDTQNALNTLTTATQDTDRALSEMGLVADIAAAKHETLAEAADQLVKAQAGNTRAFKAFGIVLDDTLPKSEAIDKALKQLQDRLSGQAPASVDTFVGHLKVLETKIHDQIAIWGDKYGPVITAAGAALTAVSAVTQILIARRIADTAAAVRETAANTALAVSYDAVAASAGAAAVAQGASAAAGAGGVIGAGMAGRIPGALGIAGRLAVPAAIAYGTYQTAKFTLSKDSQGLTGEQEHYLQKAEGMDPSRQRGQIARTFGVEKQLKEFDAAKRADKEATDAAAKANDKYTTSLIHEDNAASRATLSIEGQIKALRDSTGTALSLSSAEDAVQASMHALAQSVHDGTRSLHGHSLAAEANRNALRDSVSKMLDLIQTQKDAGVSGAKVRAAAVAMSDALERNAVKLLGNKHAVDEFLSGLGALPPQIAAALGATEILSEQVGEDVMDAFAAGIKNHASVAYQQAQIAGATTAKLLRLSTGLDTAPGATGSYLPHESKTQKAADRYGNKIAEQVVNSYTPAVSDGIDKATSDALDKAKRHAQAMAQLEKQTAQQVRQEYAQLRDQIVSTFDITNLPQKTDLFGTSYTAGTAAHAARQYVHQLEEWANLLGRLRRHGLNEVMLEQFEAAGVAAIPAMREVLKQHEIPSLNRSERRIRNIGGGVASDQVQATEGGHLARVLARLPHRNAVELEKVLHHLHIQVDVTDVNKAQGKKVRVK